MTVVDNVVVDTVLVVLVVGAAAVFLLSRFRSRRRAPAADVVVGDALQRGITKARGRTKT